MLASAQEEVQTEFVFLKVPKLWQIFGKIGLGNPPARATFRRHGVKHNRKTYRATVDPCGPYGEFKRATDACGKFKITEMQNKSSQSLYLGKVPKIWQKFGKIGLGVKVPKL